ncbi:MAG TPA: alpha/beta hydrolase, partial [Afipia sp.]
MRLIEWILAAAVVLAPCTAADAHSDLMRFGVPVRAGEVVVEGFEKPGSSRPVVLVLSGSRGFGASAYHEIAKIFRAAGLDIYLV